MEWLIVPGLGIIFFTLRQVFQDLFHPSESGSLSEFVARRTFNILRRYPKLLPDAGPARDYSGYFQLGDFDLGGFCPRVLATGSRQLSNRRRKERNGIR
jgi:hypothetical protein